MAEFLFVYGTLRSEFENPHAVKLRAEASLLGSATVRGSIFRIAHYPGYRAEPDGEVTGELYRLTEPQRTLADLDAYEGTEYNRVAIQVSSGPNSGIAGWIYEYAMQPPPSARIESGDFCRP